MSERRTCLVHHIDKDLRIIPMEGADPITLILAREHCIHQEGKFTQGKCTPDQSVTGYRVEVEGE